MGGTMRLGADPVKLHEDTRAREIYGEAVIYERHRHRYEVNNHLRAPARAGGPRLLRHLARRPPRRDHRAAGPPVLRGVAVPPGVQVAAAAAAAALPRLRRARPRRARAGPGARGGAGGRRPRRRRCPGSARSSCGRRRPSASGCGRTSSGSARSPARRGASARWRTTSRPSSGSRSREDESAAETGADAGNLYARIPAPEGAPTILFCAHLDTVPLTGPIEVDEAEGRYTNRFEAILGADNKAAVAAFMGVARRFAGGAPVGHRVPLHDLRGGGARRARRRSTAAACGPTSASSSTTRRRSAS